VAPSGELIVNVRPNRAGAESGSGVGPGGGVFILRDTNGDGKADEVKKVSDIGGTGVALANGYIYATAKDAIVRYALKAGTLEPTGAVDTLIKGVPLTGHSAYNFIVDGKTMYLNIGSRTNSCQETDRTKGSKGVDPCVELEGRAGIWTFDATKANQTLADGTRFATGIRNAVGLTWNPLDKSVYSTMHGRDQLADNWGYPAEYSAENPGEEFLHVTKGDDFGWPYCYYSTEEKKLVLAPEYGGDKTTVGRCAEKKAPVAVFPGHWAPNASMFYTGAQFPAAYKGGVFIAFHGSWNRAPLPQGGFQVVFQPMKGDKANGQWSTFADGFQQPAQGDKPLRNARPTGLAQGTDGALYVMDDGSGRVWKISYKGN
jgi:glucose/arabinose dehydrogenase